MSIRPRSLRVACDTVDAVGASPRSSRRLPSTTEAGAAVASLKKVSAVGQTTGSTSRVCLSAAGFTARSSGQSTASQTSAIARDGRHARIRAAAREDGLAQLRPPLGAEVVLLLEE
eukprot:4297906-Prymnesium_polylepis.1